MFHLHPTMKRRYDEQKAGRCIVNRRLKLACVLVPKTASTTMRYVLGPYELLRDTKDAHHRVLKQCSIVMIVREPLSRFVSGYVEVEHRLRSPKTALPVLRQQSFTQVNDPKKRFRRFVQNVHKGIFDQHLVQQSRYLRSMRCKINEWLVFERIAEHLQSYRKQHKIARGIPHRKRSKQRQLYVHLLNALKNDRRLRSAVSEMYREDFKLYEEIAHA